MRSYGLITEVQITENRQVGGKQDPNKEVGNQKLANGTHYWSTAVANTTYGLDGNGISDFFTNVMDMYFDGVAIDIITPALKRL